MNVRTNIAGRFLSLIRKTFRQNHHYITCLIQRRWRCHITQSPTWSSTSPATTARSSRRPLDKFLGEVHMVAIVQEEWTAVHYSSLVYKAELVVGGERKEYVGQLMRYRGHVSDTNNKRKSTTLTTYILRRRREGLEPEMMRWSKVSLTEPRARGDRDCSLCTTEKVNIARGIQRCCWTGGQRSWRNAYTRTNWCCVTSRRCMRRPTRGCTKQD